MKTEKLYHIGNKQIGGNVKAGIMTVATKVIPGNSLVVGFAFCSPKDRTKFSRKLGRKIAEGRMKYTTNFTGHSSNDVVRLFNKEMRDIEKPTHLKNIMLNALPNFGLYFISK